MGGVVFLDGLQVGLEPGQTCFLRFPGVDLRRVVVVPLVVPVRVRDRRVPGRQFRLLGLGQGQLLLWKIAQLRIFDMGALVMEGGHHILEAPHFGGVQNNAVVQLLAPHMVGQLPEIYIGGDAVVVHGNLVLDALEDVQLLAGQQDIPGPAVPQGHFIGTLNLIPLLRCIQHDENSSPFWSNEKVVQHRESQAES